MRFAILIAVGIALLTPLPSSAAPLYGLTDLGVTSTTITPQAAYAINNAGAVTGLGLYDYGHAAFLYTPASGSVRLDAPYFPPDGGVAYNGLAINAANHVVGPPAHQRMRADFV